jgi:hypothetical protein
MNWFVVTYPRCRVHRDIRRYFADHSSIGVVGLIAIPTSWNGSLHEKIEKTGGFEGYGFKSSFEKDKGMWQETYLHV